MKRPIIIIIVAVAMLFIPSDIARIPASILLIVGVYMLWHWYGSKADKEINERYSKANMERAKRIFAKHRYGQNSRKLRKTKNVDTRSSGEHL
jgi:hypothetical protein